MLSVIVPTRNEVDNISLLVGQLADALRGIDYELCFVDDSDDTTPRLLEQLCVDNPTHIRCLLRTGPERDGGLSTAVAAGLRIATGTYVCVMDADLQHPPSLVPTMLAHAQGGTELVVASRFTTGSRRDGLHGIGRRVVSRTATAFAQILFAEARRSSDPLSGFFLCKRALIDGIEFRPVGFKILLELLVCVPNIKVSDVPLNFAPRQSGYSKATWHQGILYLHHLRSLFFDVQGSARAWKFGLVGLSGLLIYLPILLLGALRAHLPSVVAFIPAFLLSLAWNTGLNRVWTFADQRRRAGTNRGDYLRGAVFAGLLMFASYAGLVTVGVSIITAGIISAGIAMITNALINRRDVGIAPSAWGTIAADRDVQNTLSRLSHEIGANRAYLLPARGFGEGSSVPSEVIQRVVEQRRPAMWTEAASHRPQRRTNIELSSMLIVPVVLGDVVLGIVACERFSPRGFDQGNLETAMRAVDDLAPTLAEFLGARQ